MTHIGTTPAAQPTTPQPAAAPTDASGIPLDAGATVPYDVSSGAYVDPASMPPAGAATTAGSQAMDMATLVQQLDQLTQQLATLADSLAGQMQLGTPPVTGGGAAPPAMPGGCCPVQQAPVPCPMLAGGPAVADVYAAGAMPTGAVVTDPAATAPTTAGGGTDPAVLEQIAADPALAEMMVADPELAAAVAADPVLADAVLAEGGGGAEPVPAETAGVPAEDVSSDPAATAPPATDAAITPTDPAVLQQIAADPVLAEIMATDPELAAAVAADSTLADAVLAEAGNLTPPADAEDPAAAEDAAAAAAPVDDAETSPAAAAVGAAPTG